MASPIDGIREDIHRVTYSGGRTVEVRVDEVQALCDLHDLAKDIYPFLDAVMYPLRDASYFETAGKVSLLFDSLGEILSRLEDKEEGGS